MIWGNLIVVTLIATICAVKERTTLATLLLLVVAVSFIPFMVKATPDIGVYRSFYLNACDGKLVSDLFFDVLSLFLCQFMPPENGVKAITLLATVAGVLAVSQVTQTSMPIIVYVFIPNFLYANFNALSFTLGMSFFLLYFTRLGTLPRMLAMFVSCLAHPFFLVALSAVGINKLLSGAIFVKLKYLILAAAFCLALVGLTLLNHIMDQLFFFDSRLQRQSEGGTPYLSIAMFLVFASYVFVFSGKLRADMVDALKEFPRLREVIDVSLILLIIVIVGIQTYPFLYSLEKRMLNPMFFFAAVIGFLALESFLRPTKEVKFAGKLVFSYACVFWLFSRLTDQSNGWSLI